MAGAGNVCVGLGPEHNGSIEIEHQVGQGTVFSEWEHSPRIQDLAAWPEPQNHVER